MKITKLVAILGFAGCYDPRLSDCTLACGVGDACPDGQRCDHGFCSAAQTCHAAAGVGGSAGANQGGVAGSAGMNRGGHAGTAGGNQGGVAGSSGDAGAGESPGAGSGGESGSEEPTGGMGQGGTRGGGAGTAGEGGAGASGEGGAGASPPSVVPYLKANPIDADAQFGLAVAIQGNTLVVGAPFEGPGTDMGAGAAYVFAHHGDAWVQVQRLAAVDGRPGDRFGNSLSLVGDTLIVGALNAGALHSGQVHVYQRPADSGPDALWSVQAVIEPPAPDTGDGFGDGVALQGDTLVIGAPNDDGPTNSAPDSGAVYIYRGEGATWTGEAYLQSVSPPNEIDFGVYVAISGDTIAVGAPAYTWGTPGLVDVFRNSGTDWIREQELVGIDSNDNFGSVALEGDTLVVGASYEDGNGTSESDNSLDASGAAYVFVRSDGMWTEQAYLKPRAPETGAWFGAALSLKGDTLFVSSHRQTYAGRALCGEAHTFHRSGTSWTEGAPIDSPNPSAGDRFSITLSYDGTHLAVGAPLEGGNGLDPKDDSVDQAGAAYVFTP